jgi:predicted PolB exonuclease-like 3'-5' exonuclease
MQSTVIVWGPRDCARHRRVCSRQGKIKEIADYCETDVVGTYQMWLRYELFCGTLSQKAFEASQRNLADFMDRKASATPPTLDRW